MYFIQPLKRWVDLDSTPQDCTECTPPEVYPCARTNCITGLSPIFFWVGGGGEFNLCCMVEIPILPQNSHKTILETIGRFTVKWFAESFATVILLLLLLL